MFSLLVALFFQYVHPLRRLSIVSLSASSQTGECSFLFSVPYPYVYGIVIGLFLCVSLSLFCNPSTHTLRMNAHCSFSLFYSSCFFIFSITSFSSRLYDPLIVLTSICSVVCPHTCFVLLLLITSFLPSVLSSVIRLIDVFPLQLYNPSRVPLVVCEYNIYPRVRLWDGCLCVSLSRSVHGKYGLSISHSTMRDGCVCISTNPIHSSVRLQRV